MATRRSTFIEGRFHPGSGKFVQVFGWLLSDVSCVTGISAKSYLAEITVFQVRGRYLGLPDSNFLPFVLLIIIM